jgi:hypothetical protein
LYLEAVCIELYNGDNITQVKLKKKHMFWLTNLNWGFPLCYEPSVTEKTITDAFWRPAKNGNQALQRENHTTGLDNGCIMNAARPHYFEFVVRLVNVHVKPNIHYISNSLKLKEREGHRETVRGREINKSR